jgi:CRISPR-associated protein Csm1
MQPKEFKPCLEELGHYLSQYLPIDVQQSRNAIQEKIARCGDPIFLVKGDLSGIQSYLYNVNRAEDVDGNVAKRLRGRSFYLSALCHAFSHELWQTFVSHGAPDNYILLAAGGKFLIILPEAPNREVELAEWKKQIDEWLWKETWGEIFLNLAWRQCSLSDLNAGFSGKVALPIQSKLDHGKSQKYQALFAEKRTISAHGNRFEYPIFCEDSPQKFLEECHSCRALPARGNEPPRQPDESSPDLCRQCNQHQRYGSYTFLPKHNYLEFQVKFGSAPLPKNSLEFHESYAVLKDNPKSALRVPSFVPTFPYQWLQSHGIRLKTDEEKIDKLCKECSIYKAKPEECGNVHERQERLTTRFHCLATLARKQGGAAKIAVLALDGDDFSFHFNATPGLTLVDHVLIGDLIYRFFTDHLIDVLAQKDCLLVYSGGDDLVVVGPWNSVYEVAETLYNDFTTATQKQLHFSAGLHVTNPQAPIYESIQQALDLLKQAKAHQGKNTIQLMKTIVPWPKFAGVMALAHELAEAEELEIISTGFIYGLYTICEQYELYRDEKNITGLRFLGWLASHLQRNLRQSRLDDPVLQKKATQLLDKLESLLTSNELNEKDAKLLPYLRAALDWAALKTRES